MVKGLLRKIDAFFSRFDVKNYGYKVNKWVTNGAFLMLVGLLVVVAVVDGPSVLLGSSWVECPEDAPEGRCLNPLYTGGFRFVLIGSNLSTGEVVTPPVLDSKGEPVDCEYYRCSDEYLSAGTILGVKPSWLARNFNWLAVLLVFLGLGVNHLLYNKGFFKDRRLRR